MKLYTEEIAMILTEKLLKNDKSINDNLMAKIQNIANDQSTITVTRTAEDDGVIITVIDSDGTNSITLYDGKDGIDGKDGVNGIDGVTPHIGDNGNWYIGDVDTGKPSKGESGDDIDLSDYALKIEIPKTPNDIGAEVAGTSETKVSEHNTSVESHNDIRLLLNEYADKVNALADSDDETLDQLSEIVSYIKSNRTLIESVTTTKVNVSDIIDNLTTNVSNKPLSAACGVILNNLITILSTNLTSEIARAKEAEQANSSAIAEITEASEQDILDLFTTV